MLMRSSQTLRRDKFTMNKELKELSKTNNVRDSSSKAAAIMISVISLAAAWVVASIMSLKNK